MADNVTHAAAQIRCAQLPAPATSTAINYSEEQLS